MFENAKNSKKMGDVGMGYAIAYFARQCWTVSIPITDSQEYDLVVDDGNGLKSVQVKTVHNKSKYGSYRVDLRTTGGNQSYSYAKKFDPNLVDLLFVLTGSGDKYLIPTCTMDSKRSTINVGKNTEQYKI